MNSVRRILSKIWHVRGIILFILGCFVSWAIIKRPTHQIIMIDPAVIKPIEKVESLRDHNDTLYDKVEKVIDSNLLRKQLDSIKEVLRKRPYVRIKDTVYVPIHVK